MDEALLVELMMRTLQQQITCVVERCPVDERMIGLGGHHYPHVHPGLGAATKAEVTASLGTK